MRTAIASVISLGLLSVATEVGVTGFTPARPPPVAIADASRPAVASYALPVAPPARVVEPFRAPASTYGAGHRGVDLAVAPRGRVRAAAAGIVRFAGSVAGRGVVVIVQADGVATEYEPLRPSVHAGARVGRGAVLGRVSGRHRTCPIDACVHWSARRGDTYLDPMSLLVGLGPVRLIPWAQSRSVLSP